MKDDSKKSEITKNLSQESKTMHIPQKILSLASTYQSKNECYYDEIIKYALDERRTELEESKNKELLERKNRNIAICGEYGSGKSSIINTFFSKHNEYKYINVSLGNFIEKTEDITKDNDIEKYILNQILFSVPPNKLPLSKYKRIDNNKLRYQVSKWALIIAVEYTLFILFGFILNTIKIKWYFVISLVPCALVLLKNIINNISKVKVSYSNQNLELNYVPSDEEHLKSNVEELIHYFKFSNKTIVVFEDVDRCSKAESILDSLKLLNNTINSSMNGKTVQFIYAISDKLFENSEEKTKYFDAIIPIKNYVNLSNNKKYIVECFSLIIPQLNLTNDDIENHFLNDAINSSLIYLKTARLIHDFINQFSVYYNSSYPENTIIELFYLVLYKSIYPKNFHNLINNEGRLAIYLSNEFNEYLSSMDIVLEELSLQEKKDKINEYLNNISIESENNETTVTNNPEKDNNKKTDELNKLEEDIIASDVIEKNYLRLLTDFDSDTLDPDDERVISNIKLNISTENTKVKNVKNVYKYLSAADFLRDSILNNTILLELSENDNDKKYFEYFYKNITNKKINYIINHNEEIKILEKSKEYIPRIIEEINKYITENKISKNTVDKFIVYCIKIYGINWIENNETFMQRLSNDFTCFDLLNDCIDEIELNQLNIKLNLTKVKKYRQLLLYIYNNNMYEVNCENIKILISEKIIDIQFIKILDDLKGINNNYLIEGFITNMQDLNSLISNNKYFGNSLISYQYFLDKGMNIDLYNYFIEKECSVYEDITIIRNNDYIKPLIKNSLYAINKINLEQIIKMDCIDIINTKHIISGLTDKSYEEITSSDTVHNYIRNNILNKLNLEEYQKLQSIIKNKEDKEYIINNNINIITRENYYTYMQYDKYLNGLCKGQYKVPKTYLPVYNKLKELNIISSTEDNGKDHFNVRIKKQYKIK